MAILFIVFLYFDRKDRKEREEQAQTATNKLLNEIAVSNRNMTESLNLLRTSIDTNTAEYRQHDERAIKNFEHIKEDLIILKEREK